MRLRVLSIWSIFSPRLILSSFVLPQLCVVLFGVSSAICVVKSLTAADTRLSADTIAMWSSVMMVWGFFAVGLTLAAIAVTGHVQGRAFWVVIGCCLSGALLLLAATQCSKDCCIKRVGAENSGGDQEFSSFVSTHDCLQIPGFLLLTAGHGIQFSSVVAVRRQRGRTGSGSSKRSAGKSELRTKGH
ncbi:MAG: hypothetical protein JNL58_13175 [Planctomyces sp.]|nr:hypothetical protein [Planctomyces sp.]